MKRLLLLSICLFIHTALVNSLLASENAIREQVVQQQKSQILMLKKLVNINSGTSNPKGVHKVGEIVRLELNKLGFKTKWVEEPVYMKHAGTLIAERRGEKGKKILLIGHLDTVFPRDSKFQNFVQQGNRLIGPGVLDDKGGVVVILYALKALHSLHLLDQSNITVVLTGDEEDSGKPTSISRKPLILAAKDHDVALDFEGSNSLTTATIARRGIANWRIESQGNEAHSATVFQKSVGAGAIFELARVLNSIRDQIPLQEGVTFNPGMVLGGTHIAYDAKRSHGDSFGKQNVVAKKAVAAGDIRFLTQEQEQRFKKSMQLIVNQHLPGTLTTISYEDAIPAMPPTADNLTLLKKYSEVSVDLDEGAVKPLAPEKRGAGDISHVASIVKANLAGLGPTGEGAHSVKESANLDSFPIQTARTAILLYRLIHYN